MLSHFSIYGYPVQGIFNGVDGGILEGEICAVKRSHSGDMIVTGGSNTCRHAVKLFRFPCLSKAVPRTFGGHTSPVLDVAFSAQDHGVISAGLFRIMYEKNICL